MTHIARASLPLTLVLGATLAFAASAPPAAAQVNNGVGIGPSSELERPDLQSQEQARPTRPTAKRRAPVRITTEKATRSTGATPPR